MKGKAGLIVVAALLVMVSMLATMGIVAAKAEPISGQVDKYNAQGQIVTMWLNINSSDYVTVHITDGAPSLDYYNFSDISPLLSRNEYFAGDTYNVTVAMFCNGDERDINGTPGVTYSNTYQNETNGETNGTFVFDNSLKIPSMLNLTSCPTPTSTPTLTLTLTPTPTPTLTLTLTPTSKPTDLHQEVGDAIYCKVAVPKGWLIDHAGIYYNYTGGNPNDFNNHLMFDQRGAGSRLDTLQNFKGDQEYLKSHTVQGGLDKATRQYIVNTALALKNASKPYVPKSEFVFKPLVPDWSDNYWNGTVEDIAGFRCDGYVEYAYEKNGVKVLDGFIACPVGRRSMGLFGCPDGYPYQYHGLATYCYSNRDLISHYGFRHCTPTSQMKSLVPSIWEPPTKVKVVKSEVDPFHPYGIEIEWEKATDEHSGLWGYYYAFDNCPDRELLREYEWSIWKELHVYKGPDETVHLDFLHEKGKEYWFHIRSVDNAGNMAETTHVGPFIIPCTNDSDCKKCEKCEEGKCVKIEPCCGNPDCEKELGENEENCPEDCKPGPGNDHPDETYDVSTPKITLDSPDSSTAPEIAILSSGFATSTASLLASLNEPTTFVDFDFSPDILNDYPVLIIPAGGLYGLDSLPSFKSNLEQYIKDGGTLIVFSQQHGYEFDVAPGDLGGYGWTEDQSCHYSSVGISTYHPILSGQDSVTSDVTVDGYFTKYPENATILLSRTKNGMPAMLMYEYGNGTVIASTIYTDWAYTHYQATQDGKNLVRDMLAWAKDRTEISEYGRTDTVTIRINRTIPKPDLLPEYTEYEPGEVVNVPVNITNPFNVTVDKVSFSVYDPDMEIDYVNVSITIPPNETRTVDFTYADTDKDGFYFVLYSLCIGEACVEIEDLAYFFGINVTMSVSYRVNYVLLDPDKNIITNESVVFEENVSVIELPKNVSILNLSYTNPSKLGIWRFGYEIFDVNNYSVESGVKKFAVSKYAENPGGWIYQGKDITFSVSSDSDEYACGSNATFTIHIWNNGDIDKNITVYWEWIHEGWNLLGTFLVPAHDSISIPYTYNVHTRWSIWRFWTYFYDDGKYLGKSSVGGSVFSPTVNIDIETDKTEYAIGENVLILSSLKNKQSVGHNISVTVKTLDPDNKKIYEDSFDANLSAGASANKTLDFTLPADSRGGIYIVTAEAYEKGNKIGSNSAYFVISTSYLLRLSFDKPNKVYGIRQNLSLLINVSNTGSSVWSSWINTTIPAFSFFDSKNISLNPDESKEIEYKDFLISTDFAPGKHNVLVNLSYDNTTKKDNFFIPCSDLIIEFDKKDVAAGENLSFNISNTGGVDTDFNCSFKLVDWKGKLMYEDVVEDIVLSLKNKTISFDIHNQSVNGSYYLLVSCKDIKTGKETELAALCDVSGLKADLTSDTERKVYFENENVSILTNITNLNGEIVNGTLNLKIVRVSMPTETERALARATAKLSASHNSSTAEEEESQIEEAPLPSPLPSANFSTDLSLYNLVATARAASPLANFTPTPEPENEIGEVPIEEPSPSLPPVNLTPIPEPEPEEEPNETYKPITVKLSDIIIGNETVWKDETKILNGDLIVNSTGNLTLINTTVIMNCSSDGQYHIAVQNGGEMHIFDSNITAKNTNYEYYFQVKSGAKFAMRDSELRECGYAWGTNGYLAGLWINTNDTIIVNNSITNNYYGIILRESSNSNIANNTVSSNNGYGIFFDSSNSNTIANNTVSSNYRDGIYLGSSNSNTIANNTVSSNNGYGIFFDSSNSNTIANNTVSSNNGEGICLDYSNSNTLTNNTMFEDGISIVGDQLAHWNTHTIDTSNTVNEKPVYYWKDQNGGTVPSGAGEVILANCTNVIVENQNLSDGAVGIELGFACNNTIANNTVSNNGDGIFLAYSSGNTIANNTVSNNGDGIFLAYSSGNTIANNTVSSNRNYGIYLRFSNSNTIANNTVSSNNGYGIVLYSSNSNTIANNTVSSNNGDGIYLYSSNSNTIANNTVSSNNGYGIHLHSSSGNTIANNTVSSNNEDGILFLYSNSNTIANNTVSSNRNRGIYLGDSSGNLIYNNYFNNLINAYDGEQNTWIITKTFADDGNIIGGPWLGGNYWSDYEGEDEDGDKLGDTLLPYNCSGMIKEGGDYLPLVMPLQPGEVLWEENITINLAEGETKNIISEVPASVFKDVIGKQKLSSTFYSNTTQIINISDPFFYVTPKNTSLTMETDKRVYKPNETVLIYGEVKNHASIAMDYNLSIKKDSVEIFNDSFTLATDETRYYATNTSADASFTLEGTVDGVVVLDSLSVDSPGINASIIAPDVVGIKDFDVGVLIENMGNISADLNVSLDGKRWNITVPEGESQLLETTMNTSRNMTLTVIISGDVNETIQKEIICGESAKINITPEPTYLEGEVEIPFTINNTGVRDSEFNATFSISSTGNQTITKHFFVPKGENITDCVSFNLTKGAHLLRYTSPFETVNTTINVLSPPEFVVTSIHPAELNFTIGENVTLVFTVKNVGGSEGEAALTLSITDFEDTNRTWIIAGAEEDISFYFSIPDDLEEKSYKGIYVLAGTRSEFTFFVQGANISVDASLDKSMYAEGDTAVLTLELTNECELDLDLYSRVKFNEYDSVQNFTLAGSGTETLIFYVPANFSGDTKVLYTVYMDSGRALYINSIYIYEELPDAPLRLFTDKDVYNMGEEVTIYIVDVTGTDMLNLTAPNFSYNDTISGPTTLEFTLPALRSGTYYIEYSFGNFSSTHPFDVRGYFARILEASLDKEEYISGNEMKLEMNIEANRDVSGLLKTRIYDPEENLIDEFEMNKRLIAGENKIELCRTLSTDKSGIHAIVYGFSAELSGDSSTTLVSGAEYFDAESMGLCGDVAPYPDCNGIVDMGDVILLLNNVSYLEDPRYALCNYWAGDCRCTGVRDMGDVILLLNYVSYPEDPRYVLDCC